ncbi:hypothetical protein [Pteropox virus]|uniref:Uncharacterized protein n=1 Tax=Pteropox virus TaxID=1873698 RepID=A0A1B1MRG4_9POXV|nr:hypothetical protein [Pteropox virus]ANS71125.1 hypothetical protein [Pteropox virus]
MENVLIRDVSVLSDDSLTKFVHICALRLVENGSKHQYNALFVFIENTKSASFKQYAASALIAALHIRLRASKKHLPVLEKHREMIRTWTASRNIVLEEVNKLVNSFNTKTSEDKHTAFINAVRCYASGNISGYLALKQMYLLHGHIPAKNMLEEIAILMNNA